MSMTDMWKFFKQRPSKLVKIKQLTTVVQTLCSSTSTEKLSQLFSFLGGLGVCVCPHLLFFQKRRLVEQMLMDSMATLLSSTFTCCKQFDFACKPINLNGIAY